MEEVIERVIKEVELVPNESNTRLIIKFPKWLSKDYKVEEVDKIVNEVTEQIIVSINESNN